MGQGEGMDREGRGASCFLAELGAVGYKGGGEGGGYGGELFCEV